MEYMAIITTPGTDWKVSTFDGSLPISNKIGAQRRVPVARKDETKETKHVRS